MVEESIANILLPLSRALDECRALRLTARPGHVWIEGPDGRKRLQIEWSLEQHQQAVNVLQLPTCLEQGVTASTIADAIVLRSGLALTSKMEDIISSGRLSTLAGQFLSASMGLGRNIIVAGPWAASVELIGALLSGDDFSAVIGKIGDAVPEQWPLLTHRHQIMELGPNRLGIWSLPPGELAPVLAETSGVAAWLDARRLDIALLRLEAGIERSQQGTTPPVQVLAGVNLVVVVSDIDGPRVREVAEVRLAEDGYRPQLLFSTGVPPIEAALVPVGDANVCG